MTKHESLVDRIVSASGNVPYKKEVYRVLAGKYPSERLYDDLAPAGGDPLIEAIGQAFVDLGTPLEFKSKQPGIDRPFEQTGFERNLRDASFEDVILKPLRLCSISRFSRGDFGVWYGAVKERTSMVETIFHWLRYEKEQYGTYTHIEPVQKKVIGVKINAVLTDLRAAKTRFPEIVDPKDYTVTHGLGARLHQSVSGVLFSSARHHAGDCVAMFDATGMSDCQYRKHVQYRYENSSDTVFVTDMGNVEVFGVSAASLMEGRQVSA